MGKFYPDICCPVFLLIYFFRRKIPLFSVLFYYFLLLVVDGIEIAFILIVYICFFIIIFLVFKSAGETDGVVLWVEYLKLEK